jgi:cyclophilin family peptidyl-prolyl cis-trans isomerase
MPITKTLSFAAFILALALVAAACGSDDDSTATSAGETATTTAAPDAPPVSPAETPYDTYRAAPTACGAERPGPVSPMTFDKPDDEGLDLSSTLTATLATSCGDLVVELDPRLAPLAVNSFVFLSRQGFYDGTVSHRIMPGFMFQGGDQAASGGGDPGYRILVDEWPDDGFAYAKGVMAMANAGPATTGSQFFIMLDTYDLPPNYTVIGRVIGGEDVLDKIAAIPVGESASGERSRPLETLYIERITIEE